MDQIQHTVCAQLDLLVHSVSNQLIIARLIRVKTMAFAHRQQAGISAHVCQDTLDLIVKSVSVCAHQTHAKMAGCVYNPHRRMDIRVHVSMVS